MTGFSNPIVGSEGNLVREQIKSPNFVVDVSGWEVKQNGDAFFNNVTVRGSFQGTDFIINSAGSFYYFGTPAFGNLALSITPSAGTDQFGNAFPAGISLSVNGGIGNEIQIRPDKDAILVYAG